MKGSDWRPRIGAVCRIVTAKKDGPDSQAPPGTWMVLDRHPDVGCWWLVPSNQAAHDWADEHLVEATLMFRHSSRLVRPGGKP
jgi:hypothetical protein